MSEIPERAEADAPTGLTRIAANEIEIQWQTAGPLRYTARLLRDACPCATCRERRRGDQANDAPVVPARPLLLPVLSAAEAKPMTIDAVRPVGNYAYNITFGDGHSSGIYTLEILRQLGRGAK